MALNIKRNMTADKTALLKWLKAHGASVDARDWVAAHPTPTVENCPRSKWMLWLADELGYTKEEQDAAVRPARLRALRVYVPAALDAAGLKDHAERLRNLPDDVDMEEAAAEERDAVWAVRDAAWTARAAAWAAWSAVRAAAEAGHSLCADDVRKALPDLQARLDAAIAAYTEETR